MHRMRAVHPPRHVAPHGARARRLPPAAPDRRRRGRRRRRRAPLRAGVPRMPRGGRASTREPAASDHGLLLRRLGGLGGRRRNAVAWQQWGCADRAALLAPRQRAIERDRLCDGGRGAPAHRPGHDHDEGGGARRGGLAVRPGGRARAARPHVVRRHHRQAVRDLGDPRARDIRSLRRCPHRHRHPAHPPVVLLRRHPVAAGDQRTPRAARGRAGRRHRRPLVPRPRMARPLHGAPCRPRRIAEL